MRDFGALVVSLWDTHRALHGWIKLIAPPGYDLERLAGPFLQKLRELVLPDTRGHLKTLRPRTSRDGAAAGTAPAPADVDSDSGDSDTDDKAARKFLYAIPYKLDDHDAERLAADYVEHVARATGGWQSSSPLCGIRSGSLHVAGTDEGAERDKGSSVSWDMRNLKGDITMHLNKRVAGVSSPYLYFGTYHSTFMWHTEDYDLFALSYLYFGAPKVWYVVHPDDAAKVEELARKWGAFKDNKKSCAAPMRHKSVVLNPRMLAAAGVRVRRVVQNRGEFVVVFPGAYHGRFNAGFNCAEAVNFAVPGWFEKCTPHIKHCSCMSREHRVTFNLHKSGERCREAGYTIVWPGSTSGGCETE
ncbi:Lysine-specific demethylase 4B [Blastocladiella emersonii ATCC 22665]|nr:Lysine-specific demethylase 4B [Blastocladiella emersonii ATCC 22665]